MGRSLRLGTRGSKLALAQATDVKVRLERLNPGLEIEIVPIKTSGDHGLRERLGAFVKEIQEACLAEQIDVGLHCLKDLPVGAIPGLTLTAYLQRGDPRDAFLSPFSSLDELPQGAVVGTGSVRRSSQVASIRPDLVFRPLVGNIDTRLRKLASGEYDAIILAIAGLERIGLLAAWEASEFSSMNVVPLDPAEMLPAPGQAVLVLETRTGDAAAIAAASGLEDSSTRACATAERFFLKAFGGGCSLPIAALASLDGARIRLEGLVADPRGMTVLRGTVNGDDPAAIAEELSTRLGAEGAFDLIAACEASAK